MQVNDFKGHASSRTSYIDKPGLTAPRWLLLLTAPIFIGMGVGGFFLSWGSADPATLDGGKSAVLLVLGLFLVWVGLTWSYDVRRQVSTITGVLLVISGLWGLILGGEGLSNLGFTHINRPWEGLLYLVLGASYAWAGMRKRPFDYHD